MNPQSASIKVAEPCDDRGSPIVLVTVQRRLSVLVDLDGGEPEVRVLSSEKVAKKSGEYSVVTCGPGDARSVNPGRSDAETQAFTSYFRCPMFDRLHGGKVKSRSAPST